MKAVSVPWEESFFFLSISIFLVDFCFWELMTIWSKMACQIKSFHLFQWRKFFFCLFFCNTKSSVSLLGAQDYFPRVFCELRRFPGLKWCKVFYFPLNVPGSSTELDDVQQTSLLRLSPFYLRLLKRPACSLHVTWRASNETCWPLQRYPQNYQSSASTVFYYLLASIQWEIRATSNQDQRRKWMSQCWISQKCRGK